MCHINRTNKKSSFYTYGFKVMSMSECQKYNQLLVLLIRIPIRNNLVNYSWTCFCIN